MILRRDRKVAWQGALILPSNRSERSAPSASEGRGVEEPAPSTPPYTFPRSAMNAASATE